MYEHVWRKAMKENAQIAAFLKTIDFDVPPLNPGDAVLGARTECFAMYAGADRTAGQRLTYLDHQSLYPAIQLFSDYPVKEPVTYHGSALGPNIDWSRYYGLVKLKVVPPRDLYLPLLPHKINDKLMFTLCAKCAAECNQVPYSCRHDDESRGWIGTYTTEELTKAFSLGYRAAKVYQILHFNERQRIFAPFVRQFYALKMQASGRPAGLDTDQALADYVAMVKTKTGIQLDPDKMTKNEALRVESKAIVTSLWAKSKHKILISLIRTSLRFTAVPRHRTQQQITGQVLPRVRSVVGVVEQRGLRGR